MVPRDRKRYQDGHRVPGGVVGRKGRYDVNSPMCEHDAHTTSRLPQLSEAMDDSPVLIRENG